MTRVLVVATSRKTRGGISSVIKAHESGEQWKKFHCTWIGTHRDGPTWRKICYFFTGTLEYVLLLPFSDIVHMHVSFQGSLIRKCLYMRIAKLFGKKTIVHFHPPTQDVLKNPAFTKKYQYLFSNADCVLVLSKLWKKWIGEELHVDDSNIKVLYNPCPTINDYELVPTENRENYILFAGTLIVRKGYKSLIKGFSHIADKYPQWKLLLAGVDEDQQAGSLIESLGISNQVELLGWCGKEKIQMLYKNAGIYCLASSGEGFPMVVLEAWANGTPVICTPVGGLPDIVIEGENAMTFEFDNDVQLCKQLDKLIGDICLRQKLSQAGRLLAEGVFNVDSINTQLSLIYETLL